MKTGFKGIMLASVLGLATLTSSHAVEAAADKLIQFAQKHADKRDLCRQGSENPFSPRLTYRSFGGVLCKSRTFFSFINAQCRDYVNPDDKSHAEYNNSGCVKNGLAALGVKELPSKEESVKDFAKFAQQKGEQGGAQACKLNTMVKSPLQGAIANKCAGLKK